MKTNLESVNNLRTRFRQYFTAKPVEEFTENDKVASSILCLEDTLAYIAVKALSLLGLDAQSNE